MAVTVNQTLTAFFVPFKARRVSCESCAPVINRRIWEQITPPHKNYHSAEIGRSINSGWIR